MIQVHSRNLSVLLILLFCSTGFSQLSGTYTIGEGGDYEDFSAAVADLNTEGVDGPVTFNVLNGTYNEQISIDADGTAQNTITFQAASGNASDVTLTYGASSTEDNYVLHLIQSSYVTFKDMTLTAAGSEYGIVIVLEAATNSTITDCIINGVATSSYTPNRQEVIFVQGTTPASINTVIDGNTINDGTIGIHFDASANGVATGTEVRNNTCANQYVKGIWFENNDSPVITDNMVTTNSENTSYVGIHLDVCSNALQALRNRVTLNMATGLWLENNAGSEEEPGLIANNFVRVGNGADVTAIGVELQNNSYLNFYHNTIYVNSTDNTFARALWLTSGGSNCNVINNLLSSPNGDSYVYYVLDSATEAIATSDYNNFDAVESSNFSHWGDADYGDLEAFQAASGTDANSVSTQTNYIDPAKGDLHLDDGSIGDETLAGTPLAEVTDDIDLQLRHPTLPYMGADEAETALPVELISFTHKISQNTVDLFWTTATETNNYGFEVQRKIEDGDWQALGLVPGHGTAQEPQMYHFSDTDVAPETYTYRLKQIDFDGAFAYSPELTVAVTAPSEFRLAQNFPNPFNPTTTIEYAVPVTSHISLKIYNLLGEEVATLIEGEVDAGVHEVIWNARDHASGMYFYRLETETSVHTRKLMLLR